MILKIRCRAAMFALAGLVLVAPAWADEAASEQDTRMAATRAAKQAFTEEVKSILKESGDFLAAQEKFAFKADTGHDVVQLNGQKLSFGATREVTLRRPDRLRIEVQQSDGDRRELFFDGEQIGIDLPEENAYVVVAKTGTIDGLFDYLVDDLQTPAPLHDFLTSNFYTDVEPKIRSGFYVEETTLGKRTCHHLAFRTDEVDVQIWIEDGDRPLPCSLVITHRRERSSPQFWAEFHDWDLSPKTPDKLFAFKPPKGAEKLSIQTAVEEIREEVEGQ
jgi:hypothetical protein